VQAHALAVELLINSLAVDEQADETWCSCTPNSHTSFAY
jgi:hypothetical protein